MNDTVDQKQEIFTEWLEAAVQNMANGQDM
jgi:hypothetical protein